MFLNRDSDFGRINFKLADRRVQNTFIGLMGDHHIHIISGHAVEFQSLFHHIGQIDHRMTENFFAPHTQKSCGLG